MKLSTARLRIESSTPELQWPVIRCPGADSNRYAFRHYPLKIACLPVSPPGRAAEQDSPAAEGNPPITGLPLRVKRTAGNRGTVDGYDHGGGEVEGYGRGYGIGPVSVVVHGLRDIVHENLHPITPAAQQVVVSVARGDGGIDPSEKRSGLVHHGRRLGGV